MSSSRPIKFLSLPADDKQLIWNAYNNKGLALQALAEKKDQKKLQAAEAAFRQALAVEGALPIVRYNLGVTLLQLNRDAEGIAEIKEYIKLQPTGSYVELGTEVWLRTRVARARTMRLIFHSLLREGEQIALEDLRGKVVVLDFWGTWCPPCVDSVPALRNMHKKFSKDESFVLDRDQFRR